MEEGQGQRPGMRARYEELSEEAEGLEEWKKCREAFRGTEEALFGRTSGKDASSRDRYQVWLMSEVAMVVGEKQDVSKRKEKMNNKRGQPDEELPNLNG